MDFHQQYSCLKYCFSRDFTMRTLRVLPNILGGTFRRWQAGPVRSKEKLDDSQTSAILDP
jgi:hypothetical protein